MSMTARRSIAVNHGRWGGWADPRTGAEWRKSPLRSIVAVADSDPMMAVFAQSPPSANATPPVTTGPQFDNRRVLGGLIDLMVPFG